MRPAPTARAAPTPTPLRPVWSRFADLASGSGHATYESLAEDVGQPEAERVCMPQRLARLGGLVSILLGLPSGLPVLRALVDDPRRGLYRLARTQHGAWAIALLEAIAHLQGRLGRIVELSEPTLRAREAAPEVAPLAPQRADEVTVLRERWDRCKPPP